MLSSAMLFTLFALAAAVTWTAGVYLARATDLLDLRFKLGDAFGGLVLLAIAGTLPEVAITISAAARGNLDIAAGNLIGGIAMQTMVLAVLDIAVSGDRPLSYLVGSLLPVLEAALVVGLTSFVLLGSLVPASVNIHGVSPASVLIVICWLGGIGVIQRVRKRPAWELHMPGSRPGRPHRHVKHPTARNPFHGLKTPVVVLVFAAGSVVTLVAGATLEVTGNLLATRAGVNGVVFGATALAFVTALPELSTGIAAVRLGDNQLAMSDIFGGNAFQVCLFLLADLIVGRPVLAAVGPTNAWLATLGIGLSIIYAASVIIRPRNRYLRLGIDSVLATVLFVIGIGGLALIAR